MLQVDLGNTIVRSDGSGLYGKDKKAWGVRVIARLDPDSIEVNEYGKIEFVHCQFQAIFMTEIAMDKHPYTDNGFQKGINGFLLQTGHKGRVVWSEHGRQERSLADFDSSYTLMEELFPDEFKRAREKISA